VEHVIALKQELLLQALLLQLRTLELKFLQSDLVTTLELATPHKFSLEVNS
jgi:hypothetical protein